MDDMLIKSKTIADHVAHISDTFAVLRRYQMKLNLLKCAFGVPLGNSWASWLIIEESRPIQKKYEPSLTYGFPARRKKFKA